jgi:hypothetical protein
LRVIVPKPRPKKLKGRPTFDARGNVIWKFAEKSGADVGTESLRALADGLSLEGSCQEASPDPYNQALAEGKGKPPGRSLDDMRRLNEQMKREHEELVRNLRNGTLKPGAARSAGAARGGRLRLRIGHRELLLDEDHARISIGRSEDNDVVIAGERVSREHARIEYVGDKLVVIDRSANGTFVQTEAGEISRIHCGSAQFDGEGMIGIGRRPKQNSSRTIHFTCEKSEPGEA